MEEIMVEWRRIQKATCSMVLEIFWIIVQMNPDAYKLAQKLLKLLAMIGEQFDHGDEICGAVVNVRNRQDKIAIWTKNASNEAAQVSIGKQWNGRSFWIIMRPLALYFIYFCRRMQRSLTELLKIDTRYELHSKPF